MLRAGSEEELLKTFQRRYELAYKQLISKLIPVLTGLALLAAVYALRWRSTLLETVRGQPSWGAALGGALAGSIAGALTNDSGPIIVIYGVVMAAFLVVYLRGDPRLATPAQPEGLRRSEDAAPRPPPDSEPAPERLEPAARP